MNKIINAPASDLVLKQLAEIIVGASKEKRAFTISSPYKSGLSSIFSFVANNLDSILGKKESEGILTLWTGVSTSSDETLSALIEQLNYYIPASKQVTKLSGWFGVEKSIQYLLEEDKKYKNIVIIIDNAELLNEESEGVKDKLYQLNFRFLLPVQYVFLYRNEVSTEPEARNELKDLYPLITSNVHYFGIPSVEDAMWIVSKYIEEVKLIIPQSAIKSLLDLCGNHPGLVFILLRWFKRKKELLVDIDRIIDLDEIKFMLLNIWFSFSESTQTKVLEEELYSNEFLTETRLKSADGHWFSELFTLFVKRLSNETALITPEEIKELMSEQEFEVFSLLLSNLGTELSKEEIAKCMWEDQWLDKYSDWAIAKVISKIRKKISVINSYQITAVVNGGYVMKSKRG